MDLKSEIGNADNSMKSSLDPSATNVIEVPEDQPEENSADYEADPADPDTIDPELIMDPELINAPGLDPEDDDLAQEEQQYEEQKEDEEAVNSDLDAELTDPDRADGDLSMQDESI